MRRSELNGSSRSMRTYLETKLGSRMFLLDLDVAEVVLRAGIEDSGGCRPRVPRAARGSVRAHRRSRCSPRRRPRRRAAVSRFRTSCAAATSPGVNVADREGCAHRRLFAPVADRADLDAVDDGGRDRDRRRSARASRSPRAASRADRRLVVAEGLQRALNFHCAPRRAGGARCFR